MSTERDIKVIKQTIARTEKQLAIERLKQRRADTRNKIQLGGLVIKAQMDTYSKEVILGALIHSLELIEEDCKNKELFASIGDNAFMDINIRG